MSQAKGQETPLIELENVGVAFHQKWILRDINLAVFPGEILTLIGPNGAGKTTLVKAMVGLLKPTIGIRRVKSQLKMGYMPQKLTFDPILPLTVQAFLNLAPQKRPFQHLLEILGVAHVLERQIVTLSGGECQRVLLARALMGQPDVLVLDEPNQGIDLLGQDELYKLLKQVRTLQNCGIVMVSHDLHFVMAETDRVVCLNQHICCQGHPEIVTRDPEFLHLFGETPSLALYTHKHDHQHTVQGNIVPQDDKGEPNA